MYGAAITFRRVALRAVVAVQVITAVGYVALGLPVYALGPAVFVTLYTVGSRLSRRPALILLGVVEGAMAVLLLPGTTGLSTRGVCRHLVRRLVPRRCHAPVAGCGDRARAARSGIGTGPHRTGSTRRFGRARSHCPRIARCRGPQYQRDRDARRQWPARGRPGPGRGAACTRGRRAVEPRRTGRAAPTRHGVARQGLRRTSARPGTGAPGRPPAGRGGGGSGGDRRGPHRG